DRKSRELKMSLKSFPLSRLMCPKSGIESADQTATLICAVLREFIAPRTTALAALEGADGGRIPTASSTSHAVMRPLIADVKVATVLDTTLEPFRSSTCNPARPTTAVLAGSHTMA